MIPSEMECLEQTNPQRQKVNQWLLRSIGVGGKYAVTTNRYEIFYWGDKNYFKIDCGGDCTYL